MKTHAFTFLLFSIICPLLVQSQDSHFCGSDELHKWMMVNDAQYKTNYLEQSAAIPTNARRSGIVTIPVVVHVIHLGEPIGRGSNISYDQIFDALSSLNSRWRGWFSVGDSLDMGVEFCMARVDPSGNPTTGVNRVNGAGVTLYQTNGVGQPWDASCIGVSAHDTVIKNLSKWPVSDYYNIWVVNSICGDWTGYAYHPYGGRFDGTVIDYRFMEFGSTVLAHELGHGFNLAHTFEGDLNDSICPSNIDCDTEGDEVCDTPPHKKEDCGNINPCTVDQSMWDNSRYNYMSYCFGQEDKFTPGQRDRVNQALQNPSRSSLLNSSGCSSTCGWSLFFDSGTSCNPLDSGMHESVYYDPINGCNSVLITTIMFSPSSFSNESVLGCDSVIIKGTTYYASTTFSDTIMQGSANGCDSIINYTVTINSPASCTGISGTILTETNIPIPGVTVTLSGDASQTKITSINGLYNFSVPTGGNYTITPSKSNDISTNNGNTTVDIVLIRRHILNILPLSTPYKIIAADVNAINTVTTADLPHIQSLILQRTTLFPSGKLWEFIPAGHVFADEQHPFPFPVSKTYNSLQQSLSNQNFIGIKLGDVNNSWDATIP